MNVVDDFFRKTARLDKDVIVSSREKLSYSELARNVYTLSLWFHDNFTPGTPILLLSPNNVFFVTVYLAIMKGGCVCVPVNPAVEPDGFVFVKEKTGAPYAFLHSSVAARLNPEGVYADEKETFEWIGNHQKAGYKTGPAMAPDSLAQIIFTSGSTAVPKGVMLTHENLMANTSSILRYLKLGIEDTVLVVLPFFYCYGLSLLHTHLKVGGTLVLNNNFMFLGSVLNELKKYRCTGFAGVPSHFQILLRKSDSFKESQFPDLRYVTQAGGKLHKAFILEFNQVFPEIKFFVMYGQTEATARLSYLPPSMLPQKAGSIGKGIPGVQLKVVNESGQPVAPGETGEIIASGKNIMKGYFEDEEATGASIRNGWLHTGDLGTVDEDGFIYLSARKKEIVKVGGKRVSPKEIEEVIVDMPGVVDCTVEGVEHPVLGEALKATVVRGAQSDISEEKVRAFCSSRLASYKIPSEVVFKDQMVVSATGKKVKGVL
ncbi:class I adenylate-forming enzyme family protein [Marinilabilia salmonicolor]|jgi:acyl-CoA synthetase (AMP-forming)/AMP-acid ligase II|uniref:Acyl-CoA synthetase (AMP-forming)/AMP-acid ligase II n=1 Tax=Marinilabilia salmonicolor TaxID=989 RepID=A0A2T0XEL8_9BACT|nr:AMP-binding protein [Marinilabilia salmonicolor]PRY97365.1 acyl-CoA synthetase (AMP-forming)/AMP-acid ligase II [Marinilabilia salmonicolor]RCW36734.1 acyl-CoA synthetase (AMP-forming)/AMP-acid ligase II [Marinilabilia salmonicolor]